MSLGGRISAAAAAFRRSPHPKWVVVEHAVLWRILYRATSEDDAGAWILRNSRGQATDQFMHITTLDMVRAWNIELIESIAFWRDLARIGRMVDQARTDASIDRAEVVGETAALQILKLSDRTDKLEPSTEKGSADD